MLLDASDYTSNLEAGQREQFDSARGHPVAPVTTPDTARRLKEGTQQMTNHNNQGAHNLTRCPTAPYALKQRTPATPAERAATPTGASTDSTLAGANNRRDWQSRNDGGDVSTRTENIVQSPTRDFTRTGCTVGARIVTYQQLEQHYVCDTCGGAIVHRIARENDQTVDWAECGRCKARIFVSQRLYDRQCQEYHALVKELPPELATLLPAPATPEQVAWADEDLATFKSALPGWLSSEKQHENAQQAIV